MGIAGIPLAGALAHAIALASLVYFLYRREPRLFRLVSSAKPGIRHVERRIHITIGIVIRQEPKESRRWLKPRVPKEQLYRLSPRRPKPKRLGHLERWDWIRRVIRTWWIWMAVAIAAHLAGHWIWTLITGAVAFFFYHTTPESHPAVYALETDLDVESPEFPVTMAGMTGMPLGARQSGCAVQQRRRIFPGDASSDRIGRTLRHHGAVHFLGWAGGAAFRRGLRRKSPQRNSR